MKVVYTEEALRCSCLDGFRKGLNPFYTLAKVMVCLRWA
jgi:hypothetical protein